MNTVKNVANKFNNLVLFSYWRSSCSWRVRIVMNLKKLQYEIKPVHLVKMENKTEEFTKINPYSKDTRSSI